jgi:hypothetical protein
MPNTNEVGVKPKRDKELREAAHVLSLEVGAREAARRMGLSESRVCSWSSRYKWKLPVRNQHAIIAAPSVDPYRALKDASISAKSADSLVADLKQLEEGTRSSMARAARRAAQEAEDLERVLPRTQQLQQLSAACSRLFGWDTPTQTNNFNTLVVSQDQLEQIRQLRGT